MKVLTGTYGGSQTPCNVFYYNGWYCVEGSTNVNYTREHLENGVDVEAVEDLDCFTWNEPINTATELMNAVEA